MTTFRDVKAGRVTLAELVRMNDYLTMVSDIEYWNMTKKMPKGGGQLWPRRR